MIMVAQAVDRSAIAFERSLDPSWWERAAAGSIGRGDLVERWPSAYPELDRIVIAHVWDGMLVDPTPAMFHGVIRMLRGPLAPAVASRLVRVELHGHDTKAAYWKHFDQKCLAYEEAWAPRLQRFFEGQARRVAAAYRGGKRGRTRDSGDDWWSGDQYDAELELEIGSFLPTVVGDFGAAIAIQLGGEPFEPTAERVLAYLKARSVAIADLVNGTTEETLREVVAAAEAEGLSIDGVAGRIVGFLADASPRRATLIARTEVLGAANYATIEGARQSGVATGKEFLTTVDDLVCPICEPLDGLQAALDGDFAGEGDPPIHPACRCTVLILTADDFNP